MLHKAIVSFAFLLGVIVPMQGYGLDARVGIQLWSVKDDLKADFKGTIEQLAEMGFAGVELAGEYGGFADNPEGLAQFIKSTGMTISGAHILFTALTDDALESTLLFFERAGVSDLIIAYDDRAFSPDTVNQTIADLNRLLPVLEERGFSLGYHNHAQEFGAYKNATLWDHIGQSTPSSLVLQLDIGWATTAGVDPVALIQQHPNRTYTTHFKVGMHERKKGFEPIIGQDSAQWSQIVDALETVGGTRWIILEQEIIPDSMTAIEAVRASKEGLDEILQYREQ